MTTQLSFHSHAVTSFDNNDAQIWLTAAQLTIMLNYADDKAILRIYSRNAHEFSKGMTTVVKLTTNGINFRNRRNHQPIY